MAGGLKSSNRLKHVSILVIVTIAGPGVDLVSPQYRQNERQPQNSEVDVHFLRFLLSKELQLGGSFARSFYDAPCVQAP